MKPHQLSELEMDFEEWKALAQNDPTTFEAKRRQCIETLIESAPEEKRRRLRGLQWQIDQTRDKARTPMASCIAISNMMWDSLYQLNQHQRELVHVASEKHSPRTATSVATVLPFRARQS